jgi:GxxExxY protein
MASESNRPPINDPETFEIIGAAFEVHREFGPGFSEPIYREAFTNELLRRNAPFAREVNLPVYYKGDLLALHYRADFVCYDDVLVELKALCAIGGREFAQVKNYLRVTRKRRTLLINFGADSLEHRRVTLTDAELGRVSRASVGPPP